MALTQQDVQRLFAPFDFGEHDLNQNGFFYIAEYAVMQRLNEIDPSWEFRILAVNHRTSGAENMGLLAVEVHAQLIVKGVTREDYGQGGSRSVGKDGSPLRDGENTEAVKGAVTDALRRTARKFGIGAYLTSLKKKGEEAKRELMNYIEFYNRSIFTRDIDFEKSTFASQLTNASVRGYFNAVIEHNPAITKESISLYVSKCNVSRLSELSLSLFDVIEALLSQIGEK